MSRKPRPSPLAPWAGAVVLELLRQGWAVRLRPLDAEARLVRVWAVAEDGRQARAEGSPEEALHSLLSQVDRLHLAELAPGEAALDRARVSAQRARDLIAEQLASAGAAPGGGRC